MYKVSFNGVEKEIEAASLTINNGMIIFFEDETCTKSRFVVPAGNWDYLNVLEGSEALVLVETPKLSNESAALAESAALEEDA